MLRVLLAEEVAGRDLASKRIRTAAAGFPSGKTFDSWRPEDSDIPRPIQQALMRTAGRRLGPRPSTTSVGTWMPVAVFPLSWIVARNLKPAPVRR